MLSRLPSRLGRGIPPPHSPPPRRLRRLDLGAFVASSRISFSESWQPYAGLLPQCSFKQLNKILTAYDWLLIQNHCGITWLCLLKYGFLVIVLFAGFKMRWYFSYFLSVQWWKFLKLFPICQSYATTNLALVHSSQYSIVYDAFFDLIQTFCQMWLLWAFLLRS